MNDANDKEKQSPTYKKYAKNLGKLFWERKKIFNSELNDYVPIYELIMITGLNRRWGNGRYIYNLSKLGAPESDWRSNYNSECSYFIDRMEKNFIVEVDSKNPVPPQIPNKK